MYIISVNFGHAIDHIPHVAWCIDVNVDSLTSLCGRQRKVAKRHALFQYSHTNTSDLHREAGPTFLSTHCSSSVFGTGTSAILPVVAFLSACDEVFGLQWCSPGAPLDYSNRNAQDRLQYETSISAARGWNPSPLFNPFPFFFFLCLRVVEA